MLGIFMGQYRPDFKKYAQYKVPWSTDWENTSLPKEGEEFELIKEFEQVCDKLQAYLEKVNPDKEVELGIFSYKLIDR